VSLYRVSFVFGGDVIIILGEREKGANKRTQAAALLLSIEFNCLMNFFKFFIFLTLFNSTLAARFYITREKALVPPITVGSKRHVTFVTHLKKKQKQKKNIFFCSIVVVAAKRILIF
jgi:hypothetical protein